MDQLSTIISYPWGMAQRAWSWDDGAQALAGILWTGLVLQFLLAAYPKPLRLRASFTYFMTYPAMLVVASVGVLLRAYGVISTDAIVFWVLVVGLIGLGFYLAISQKAWLRGLLLTVLLLPHAGLMLMSVNEDFWPAEFTPTPVF